MTVNHDHGTHSQTHHGHDHGPGDACLAPAGLTPARQRILDLLTATQKPLGAYDLIDQLASTNAKRPAPISVYRALDYLVDQGLVHRLASRNAFLACRHGHAASEPVVFLICDTCGAVSEATSAEMRESLDSTSSRLGFRARSRVIELAGECAQCQAAA